VTHRSFKDRQGKLWDVWQVHPSQAERRFSQRRVNEEELTDTAERRSGLERRESEATHGRKKDPAHHRSLVAAEFAYGWLCFETFGEKRRLAPVPEGWERADDETIEQWCCVAKPVARRPSGSTPTRGTGGAEKLG
jgi:hypothetical protein